MYKKNRNRDTPKFFKALVFLYLYEYKHKNFNLDWLDYLFKLLSVQTQCYKNLSYFYKIKKWVSKGDVNHTFYKKYIVMNSSLKAESIKSYNRLSKNRFELRLLHYSIDKLNQVKSKIYKIRDI